LKPPAQMMRSSVFGALALVMTLVPQNKVLST